MPIFCFGQQNVCVYNNYEVLGNDTINWTTDNIKEGNWIDYEVAYESIECFTPKKCYHQKAIRFIRSKGEYSNEKKLENGNIITKVVN